MDLELNYKPVPWQEKAHISRVNNQFCVGGLGCIREDSLIDTARGRIPIGDTVRGERYVSFDHRSGRFVFQEGSVGFPKGKSNLYRVIHDQGEFVANEHHLVLGASCKYLSVFDLSVGDQLLYSPPSPPLSSEALSHQSFDSNAQRWKQIVLDSLDHYAFCIRRYGQRLLNPEVFFQLFSPLQIYALRFSHIGAGQICALQGDPTQDMELKHILSVHKCDLQSKKDCILRGEHDEEGVLNEDSEAKPFERIFQDTQQFLRFPKISELRQKAQQFFFDHKEKHIYSPLPEYRPQSTVLSIEKLGEDWYWDIQVPETNNYVSGGLVHHNSGKSSYAIRELQACALNNPKGLYLVARGTLPSLRDSTYRSFFEHTEPELIRSHNKANLQVTLINGAEFIFRPLDDMEKFKSMQISGFFIDEVNEISEDMYLTLRSRVRQVIDGHVPFYRTIAAMNPEDETHWVAQRVLYKKPANEEVIFSTTYDNQHNLPPGYIEELKSMYSEDMQKRMIFGQFGKVFKGNPVFPQFTRGSFVAAITTVEKYPIYRGIDFGYNKPACSWLQFVEGQIRIYHAIKGERVYLEDFVKDQILKVEAELFPNWKWGIKTICDPAGSQESDKGRSSVEILQDLGIFPMYKRAKIEEGIKAINHFLNTKQLKGEPNLLIHPRADILIQAFRGGYCWDEKKQGQPDKTKGYDDVMDSARYPIAYIYKWARAGALQDGFGMQRKFISKTGSRIFEY